MITDLIKDSKYKTNQTCQRSVKPELKRTIRTVIGDIRRWSFDISNMPLTKEDAGLILEYYNLSQQPITKVTGLQKQVRG